MRVILVFIVLVLCPNIVFGQKLVQISAAQAQRGLDSLRMLPIVRQEANAWRSSAQLRARAIDSLQYAGQMARDAHDSTKAALGHEQQLSRSKDVQIAVLRDKATRRTLTTIGSVLGNLVLAFFLVRR